MQEKKKCSGCKREKSYENFYKNKLVLDGHSNYCIDCTRENSKRYFKRKKEKLQQVKNDNLLKMTLLSNYNTENEKSNADNLMKILMIERLLRSVGEEVDNLKRNYIKTKETEVFMSETSEIN